MMVSGVGTKHYFHQNHLYSVAAMTNSTGAVVERYRYDAYGKRTVTNAAGTPIAASTIGQQRGFTGYYLDSETGLDYARARMYSAGLGRFIGRDPIQYVDGASLYSAYFIPNAVDPEGLAACVTPSIWGDDDCKLGSSEWIEAPAVHNLEMTSYRVRNKFGAALGGVQFGEMVGYFTFDVKWIANCECICRCDSSSPYDYDHDDVVEGGYHFENVPIPIPLPRVPWPVPGPGHIKLLGKIAYGTSMVDDLLSVATPITAAYAAMGANTGAAKVCEGREEEIRDAILAAIANAKL